MAELILTQSTMQDFAWLISQRDRSTIHLRDSVDCVVTSPPYKLKDGYTDDLMPALSRILQWVVRPGGRLFLNFGQLREGPDRPYEALAHIQANTTFQLSQTIAWVKSIAVPSWRQSVKEELVLMKRDMKTISPDDWPVRWLGALERIEDIVKGPGAEAQYGHYQPLNTDKVLNYCWEPVFVLFKPPEEGLDRLSAGVPFADKTNMNRGSRGKNGDLHCRGDTWFIPHKTTGAKTKKRHGHEFPEQLVERALRVANLPEGATVLDPFCGSGTTLRVAKRLGYNAWGLDRSRRALELAQQGWDSA